MTSTTQEKAFLRVAVAAIPRVTELIQRFPPDDQAGALETAERSFRAAALDYGCTEIAGSSPGHLPFHATAAQSAGKTTRPMRKSTASLGFHKLTKVWIRGSAVLATR